MCGFVQTQMCTYSISPLLRELHWLPVCCANQCWLLPLKAYIAWDKVIQRIVSSLLHPSSPDWGGRECYGSLLLRRYINLREPRRTAFSVVDPSLWNIILVDVRQSFARTWRSGFANRSGELMGWSPSNSLFYCFLSPGDIVFALFIMGGGFL